MMTGTVCLKQKNICSAKTVKNSQTTVKTAKMTIGVPIVAGLPRLYQQCNNSVPIVKNSQKMSIGVPSITCLHSTQSPPNTQIGFQKSIRRQSEYTSKRRVSHLFLSKYPMQRIYSPVCYFRSGPVIFVRCSIYTCVCRLTHRTQSSK